MANLSVASSKRREPAKGDSRMEALKARLDPQRIPKHVAIITDGNGRWAQQRQMPRVFGHREGYKTVRQIVRDASDLGIAILTLYAFSSENWSRPKPETEALMSLFEYATRSELDEMMRSGVRIRFLGRREGLSESLLREMDRSMEMTSGNTRLTLNLALNYGGRGEIVDAVRRIAAEAVRGEIAPDEITEAHLSARMYAPDLPDPDLLIRTAGEMRISNFLLWGIAYAEIWVTQRLWPDFTAEDLTDAIEDYQRRVRKFGAVVNG